MISLERQTEYWNKMAADKEFTHPLDWEQLGEDIDRSAAILDLGCGYGRLMGELKAEGYSNVTGIDISADMIARAKQQHPEADLRVWDSKTLPFDANVFEAVLLVAVLNCIPTDAGQEHLISEISRVLAPNGLLFISDYPFRRIPATGPDTSNFRVSTKLTGFLKFPMVLFFAITPSIGWKNF